MTLLVSGRFNFQPLGVLRAIRQPCVFVPYTVNISCFFFSPRFVWLISKRIK